MTDANQKAYNEAGHAYRKELTNYFFQKWGPTIRYGPFKGIQIPQTDIYGGAKLLGLYEAELHPLLHQIACLGGDVFVNVGSGDAVYCMGMTKLLEPTVPIVGIDISQECVDSANFNIAANGLSERIRIRSESTPAILEEELRDFQQPIVFMDCEGAERELLDPQHVPSLLRSLILVEIHPFEVSDIQELIQTRFAATHRIRTIQQGARNVHVPELQLVHENDKYLLCSEGRPITMEWMFLVPNTLPYVGIHHGTIAAEYHAAFWKPTAGSK